MKQFVAFLGVVVAFSAFAGVKGARIGGESPPSAVDYQGNSSVDITAPGFHSSPLTDYEVYVDTSGDDSNTCLTAGDPCQTIDGALSKIPDTWTRKARVHLSDDEWTYSSASRITVGHGVGSSAEPIVFIGELKDCSAVCTAASPCTITGVTLSPASTAMEIADAGLSPTVTDEFEGCFLRMTSGSALNMQRIVRGNNTVGNMELNMSSWYGVVPAIGDTFVLETPATTITFAERLMITSTGRGVSNIGYNPINAAFKNIKFNGQGGFGVLYVNGIGVAMTAVRIETNHSGTGVQVWNGGTLVNGPVPGITADGVLSELSPDRYAMGTHVKLPSCGTGGLAAFGGTIMGWVVARNAKLWGRYPTSLVNFYFLSLKGCRMEGEAGAVLQHTGWSLGPRGQISGSSSYGLQLINGANYAFSYIDINNSGASAIQASEDAYVYLSNVGGTGNAAYGLDVQYGSVATVGSSVSVTGASGDVRVGQSTTTYASLYTSGIPVADPVGGVATKYPASGNPSNMSVGSLTIGASGSTVSSYVACSATLATSSIPAGTTGGLNAVAAQTITCSGAAVGAMCVVGSPSTLEAGLQQTCHVSSAGNIELRTANNTGSAIAPAGSQTVSVGVFNP